MATSDTEINFRKQAISGLPLASQSPLYVVRSPAETQAGQTLLEPGGLVRIRGSRDMGKTSLIQRLLHTATVANYQTVYLSLPDISTVAGNDLESFLQEFCLQVGNALQLPALLDEYWDDFFGSTICCKSYFEEYLLIESPIPIVLALDDVDCLFSQQDLADDFFGLLRAWHEEAKTRDIWKQLRLIVAHSTDLYVPRNIHKSPFNVGLPIDLQPFSVDQVQTLLNDWQVALEPTAVTTLTNWVGGRPYLVQLASRALARNGGDLDQLIAAALAPKSPFADPLRQLELALATTPAWQATLAALAAGQAATCHPDILYRLDSLGLVTLVGQQAELSCDLYAQWVAAQ